MTGRVLHGDNLALLSRNKRAGGTTCHERIGPEFSLMLVRSGFLGLMHSLPLLHGLPAPCFPTNCVRYSRPTKTFRFHTAGPCAIPCREKHSRRGIFGLMVYSLKIRLFLGNAIPLSKTSNPMAVFSILASFPLYLADAWACEGISSAVAKK
jgi:hypothetical protein